MRMLLRVLAFTLLAVLGTAAAAHAAPGGYGPTSTGPSGTPGGYTEVVASETFGPEGGEMTAAVEGGNVRIVVPAGAFGAITSAQVVVTEPDLDAVDASLDDLGMPDSDAVLGVGLKALDESGEPIEGQFVRPLTVTMSGSGLGEEGQQVMRFATASSLEPVPTQAEDRALTISVPSDPNYVVVEPEAATSGPTSGSGAGSAATADDGSSLAETGTSTADKVALALLLMAGGAALSVAGRRALRAR